jgi:hypothetical protein
MMNDPALLEASRALADQLLMQGLSPEQLLEKAFQKIICRRPDDKEKKLLLTYWTQAQEQLKNNPAAAQQLMQAGNYKARTTQLSQLAIAMQSIQIIYNLQEAITKT